MQLVINTRGASLRRRSARFIIKSSTHDRPFEFAAEKVQSIVVSTGIHLTSNVIQLAAEKNVDIVFLDTSGAPIARVWQTRMGSTAAIRRRQLELCDTDQGLEIARQWIVGKLRNQSKFLEELRHRRPEKEPVFESTLRTIQEVSKKLEEFSGTLPDQRNTVMGWEGTAGRVYFDCLAKLMPSEYQFNGRSRQPAVDPFNAMLNYAYGVLYSSVERACILAGLDPFIGFLHTDNYNKRSLVFDMIEPFRIIAERATVLFFTGRRAKREFFRDIPGGIELAPEGRAALITNLNERLDKAVKYPIQRPKKPGGKKYRRIKLRATIQYEAHSLANRLLGKDDLPRIVDTETLFSEPETP